MTRPLWSRLRLWLSGQSEGRPIPDPLWQHTLQQYAFFQSLSAAQLDQLRALSSLFLQRKQFTGVQGLEITDQLAVAIAAQACLLLLPWGKPSQALRWYDDFVGIVVYPQDMLASRQVVDGDGVVHSYQEELMGEAVEGGPIALSWQAIQPGGHPELGPGTNVIIHEFAHKLDMANGGADGCPPLPAGFMGLSSAAPARQLWSRTWLQAYEAFCDALSAHERFGQPAPWLDPYAAEHPSEFFAVACEAYWTLPEQFAQQMPTLKPLLDGLFQRAAP